jgi:hypothetical protein
LMTQDLSQAEKDLLLATYIPFSGTGKPTKSR